MSDIGRVAGRNYTAAEVAAYEQGRKIGEAAGKQYTESIAITERDSLRSLRATAVAEREAAVREALEARQNLQGNTDSFWRETDRLKADRDAARRERDEVIAALATATARAEAAERELVGVREVADPDNETPELSLRDRVMHVGEQAALLVSVNRLVKKARDERDQAAAAERERWAALADHYAALSASRHTAATMEAFATAIRTNTAPPSSGKGEEGRE